MMDDTTTGTSVGALQRITEVIHLVSEQPGITLTALAARMGVHKSTAYRICSSLVRAGFLEQLAPDAPATGRLRYRLGLWLFVLGSRAVAALEIKRHAPPVLRRLARAVQLPVYLTIVWNGLTICIEEEPGPAGSVWLGSSVGVPHPVRATATGKLFLASLPEAEARAYLAARDAPSPAGIAHPIRDRGLLDLAAIRETGYAFNDEETEYGVRYLGVPVYDAQGRFLAAVTVGATVEQHSREALVALLPQLRAAAAALGARVARDVSALPPDTLPLALPRPPSPRSARRRRSPRREPAAVPAGEGLVP